MMNGRRLTLAMILISTGAMAQALPNSSIELFCAKRANAAGKALENLFVACVEAERSSLADLQSNWTDYSAPSRAQCLKNFSNRSLYSDLEACIEAADAVRAGSGK